MEIETKKIALFIDCDNVSYKAIDGVISELSKYGKVNVRNAIYKSLFAVYLYRKSTAR